MATSGIISAIRDRYDKRAPKYDSEGGFHPQQAADYIKWMSINSGDNVLDLACGTGGVTIPAAKAVGPSGSVVGVDISSTSLSIARNKAKKENLGIVLLEHDVTNLDGLEKYGIKEERFDIITCASAFVLFKDPSGTVQRWAKLLKKGGRLIFDVPSGGSLIKTVLLERVAKDLEIDVFAHRLHATDDVRKWLEDAGLDDSGTFITEAYENGTQELTVKEADKTFDAMFAPENWGCDWYRELAQPGTIDKARDGFRQEIEKIADKNGKVVSYLKLIMAVGKKL